MSPARTCPRLVTPLLALLLAACGGGGSKSDTDTDGSTAGDGTFGMGETSATPTDPTTPTTTVSTVSSDGTVTSAGTATGDPTITTTTTTGPDTVSVSASDSATVTSDPTVTSTTETTDPGSSTTMPSECGDPPGQPHSAGCTDPSGCGCASNSCFVIPVLGGFCGECREDEDCPDGGCTIPNPIMGVGAVCNTGMKGDGCQSDAVCADPEFAMCAPVLKVEGILTASTCGACKSNADCPQGLKNCTPVYDLPAFSGVFECLPDGSVPNNEGCNLQLAGDQPIGNKACASGFCGTANVMGLLKVGICGECNADADCGPGESCTNPVVDLNTNTLIGATCD